MKPINMKSRSSLLISSIAALGLIGMISPAAANPEIGAAIGREFGESAVRNILLVRAGANEAEPVQWTVYYRDPHHDGKLVRSIVTKANDQWTAAPAGGEKTLKRAPSRALQISKATWTSQLARDTAAKAAEAAKTTFAKIEYQLAADETTGEAEWGLGLLDASGYEVGFVVVSAETGAVRSQDWTPKVATESRASTPEAEGERAAKRVKAEVRKAWRWGENAGRKTGSFFRELFKPE